MVDPVNWVRNSLKESHPELVPVFDRLKEDNHLDLVYAAVAVGVGIGAREIKESGFDPDWASAPGETIQDLMTLYGMNALDVGHSLHLSAYDVDRLLAGDLAITKTLAMSLEKLFNVSASFWLNREADYRSLVARLEDKKRLHLSSGES